MPAKMHWPRSEHIDVRENYKKQIYKYNVISKRNGCISLWILYVYIFFLQETDVHEETHVHVQDLDRNTWQKQEAYLQIQGSKDP